MKSFAYTIIILSGLIGGPVAIGIGTKSAWIAVGLCAMMLTVLAVFDLLNDNLEEKLAEIKSLIEAQK